MKNYLENVFAIELGKFSHDEYLSKKLIFKDLLHENNTSLGKFQSKSEFVAHAVSVCPSAPKSPSLTFEWRFITSLPEAKSEPRCD